MQRLHLNLPGFLLAALVAGLFTAAQWLGEPLLVMWRAAALVFVGLLIIEWYFDRSNELTAIAHCEGNPELGQRFELCIWLKGTFPYQPHIEARLTPSESFTMEQPARMWARLSSKTILRVLLRALQPGPGRPGTLHLRVGGLFGLAAWQRSIEFTETIAIHTARATRSGSVAGELPVSTHPDRRAGAGLEIDRLREARPGDSVRMVDWKATARSGKRIVRVMTEDTQLDVCVMLDASQYGLIQLDRLPRFAHLTNIASRLVQRSLRTGDRVSLCVFGSSVHAFQSAGHATHQSRLLNGVLQGVRVEPGAANYLGAYMTVASRLPRRSLLVLLTHLDHASLNDHLERMAALASKKHFILIASTQDTELEGLVSAPAHHWRDPFVSLAAAQQIEDTHRQVGRLKHLGVRIVHDREEYLDESLLSTYHELRTRHLVA